MVDWFRRVENLNVEIASLETGDYLIPDKIVIERKTVADFALSLVEDRKRLFNQTNRIALSGMRGILILEGNIYTQTSLPLNNITGTLSYLVAIQGMTLYQTLSMNHSADMIVKLLRHSVHGLGYDLGLRAAAPKDPSKAAAFVLEGIPGVSAATAKTLMETFGSIVGVAGASVSDLRNVSGIGPKRATKIYDTLHATWESR
jgi:Fanconi anemia group M protein